MKEDAIQALKADGIDWDTVEYVEIEDLVGYGMPKLMARKVHASLQKHKAGEI